MAILEQKGGTVFTAKARDWRDSNKTVVFGMPMSQLNTRSERGLRWMLGQLYGIIEQDLINPKHIYLGLNRAMYVNGDAEADASKLVYCLKPKFDFTLAGDKFSPTLQHRSAPEGGPVFAVIISPNEDLTNFPDIAGWIEHWSWVDSCPNDSSKPVNHDTRYGDRL